MPKPEQPHCNHSQDKKKDDNGTLNSVNLNHWWAYDIKENVRAKHPPISLGLCPPTHNKNAGNFERKTNTT